MLGALSVCESERSETYLDGAKDYLRLIVRESFALSVCESARFWSSWRRMFGWIISSWRGW